MKPRRLWVLLIDDCRARVLRDVDPADGTAAPELFLRAPHDALRRIVTARHGRSLASFGHDRAATQAALRALDSDAATFAAQVVDLLEAHRVCDLFDHLAVYSSTVMLCLLQGRLTPGLQRCLIRQEALCLVHLPHRDAVDFLRDHIVNGQVIRFTTSRSDAN